MRKTIITLALVLTFSACTSSEPANYIVVPEGTAQINSSSYQDAEVPQPKVPQAIERSIIVREKGPFHITYEYRDVRIDDVAKIADEYCEKKGLRAYLKESLTHRNNNRLSTFDCIVLK